MSTTVRIDAAERERLRRLQDRWRRVHGSMLPQKELLERALGFLERHEDEFLAEAGWRPLTEPEIRRLRRGQADYGDWTVDNLDDVVYGGAE